jgi:hypothetical protein
MDRGIATAAMWLGPALACWATHEPWIAVSFIASLFGTICVWPIKS